ncbi:hypothetical protein HDU96_004675, partial [Phlyctochytrium bullatum]
GIVVAPPPLHPRDATPATLATWFRGWVYPPLDAWDADVGTGVEMTAISAERVAGGGDAGEAVYRVTFAVGKGEVGVVRDGWVVAGVAGDNVGCRDAGHPFGACVAGTGTPRVEVAGEEGVRVAGEGWVVGRVAGVVEVVEVVRGEASTGGVEIRVTLSGPVVVQGEEVEGASSDDVVLVTLRNDTFGVEVLPTTPGRGQTMMLEAEGFRGAGDGSSLADRQDACAGVPGVRGVPVSSVVAVGERREGGGLVAREFRVALGVSEDGLGALAVVEEEEEKGGWVKWFGGEGRKKGEKRKPGGVVFVGARGVKGVEGEEGETEEVSCRPFAVDLDEC